MIFIPLVILIIVTPARSQQKFSYTSQEEVIVERNSSTELVVSLTTEANEYLSEASIQAFLNINQNSLFEYNLVYFNYQTA